eukprot:GFKZ01010256.1.p1 GENE.GFKZ01010256.1~~GFKZ01010256.1.p1  ORF type:complete len:523 (+),score=46.59 GFKZ01010256.1:838-2406(+)
MVHASQQIQAVVLSQPSCEIALVNIYDPPYCDVRVVMHLRRVIMNSSNLQKTTSVTTERNWTLDPEEWTHITSVLVFLVHVVFGAMRLIARLRAALLSCPAENSTPFAAATGTGLQKDRTVDSGLSNNRLAKWQALMPLGRDAPSACYDYPTRFDRFKSVFMTSIYMGYLRHVATRVREGCDASTVPRLRQAIASIRLRALQSTKFRGSFAIMVGFMEDFEASSFAAITEFVKILAGDMLGRKSSWHLRFLHTHSRGKVVGRDIYETTLAMHSIFQKEGSGIESFLLRGTWKDWKDTLNGSLTLIMQFVIERCMPTGLKSRVVEECSGAERILQATSGEGFRRFASTLRTRDEWLFKDRMMLDISLNCCNEYVESSWSVSSMERAVWALQYARRHLSSELYEELKGYGGKRNLDLTHLNPLLLITLSAIGLIRFEGLNDCVYQMTKCNNAPVLLHGNMPMPTIADLLSLRLLRRRRNGSYTIEKMPGSDGNMFRAVHVGERVKLVRSTTTTAFPADPNQRVG